MKDTDEKRRQFLQRSVLSFTGALFGLPILQSCGSSSDDFTINNEGFRARSLPLIRDEHSQLSGRQIEKLVKGNTGVGLTYSGAMDVLYYQPDGSAHIIMDDGRQEIGWWQIEDDIMTFQWPSIGGSDLMECAIFQYGNSILHLALSKQLLNLETDADRWVWFHIVKGKSDDFNG